MSAVQEICEGCNKKYFSTIAAFYENESASRQFLRNHGVLPKSVMCPRCQKPCSFREDRFLWRCTSVTVLPKKKKRVFCTYSISETNGTFLLRIPAWKVILFVNHFLSHLWDHKTVRDNLQLSTRSSVDWRSFCSEVCKDWLQSQEPIGGDGVAVEIDETLLVKRQYNKGRILNQIWLFGGIERVSKRCFIIALAESSEGRNEETIVPLITKFIRPGSIIHGDYAYHTISHLYSFADPDDRSVHTQNIEQLWHDVKEWIKRPGIRPAYIREYLARYLFIRSEKNPNILLHKFFVHAGLLYKHTTERKALESNTK